MVKIVGFYHNEKIENIKKQMHLTPSQKRVLKRRLKKLVIFTIAIALNYMRVAYGSPFDKIGSTLFGIMKNFAFWVGSIMCGLSIIQAMREKNLTKAISAIMSFAIMYGSFEFVPWFFREIDAAFRQFVK